MAYDPPEGKNVGLRFTGHFPPPLSSAIVLPVAEAPPPALGAPITLPLASYFPPPGNKVALEFAPGGDDPGGDTQYLFPVGVDQLAFGNAESWLYSRYVLPEGIASTLAFGTPSLYNYETHVEPSGFTHTALGHGDIRNRNRFVTTIGFDSQAFGTPEILNWNKTLYPNGFDAALYGRAAIANTARLLRPSGFDAFRGNNNAHVELWRRHVRPSGFSRTAYGRPAMFGGVKYVRPNGRSYLVFGRPSVINTTADQFVRTNGIPAPGIGRPLLSPRTLFASGFLAGRPGNPLIQRNPNPRGWESSRTGTPEVDYKTKLVEPEGIAYGEWVGYPRVFDRAQYVLASSVVEAGVFGDTLIRNQSRLIQVPGSDFFLPSDWATVESNRRALLAAGFDAARYGNALVENATPSFAPQGFDSLQMGEAAIGFAVRYLQVPGFYHTVLGRPAFTKTPELQPRGIAPPSVGQNTIWHRVRTLEVRGRDSQSFGALTTWFRFRYLEGTGFSSPRYGTPTLHHSLRTLLAQGAEHARYGRPRIGNLDRTISPQSVFEIFAHQHMVGGTRFILPRGYVATLFGTRIIPPIQSVYPQGFAGAMGIPSLLNINQWVHPEGIATGVQPADRWGMARAFNLLQHISQDYEESGGLAPPPWPQWTRIENRNRFVRTAGRDVSGFGYNQIANNARPLLPQGIEHPQEPDHYEAGMVSHSVRYLRPEGMEPPYISSWARAYNDAFVVAPTGPITEEFGEADVKNTRRTFRWIGAFESMEFGHPMIAFREREITFEHRYTIFPPYVRLPVVDLYTRYVDMRGFDASGMGWADLMIRWNIITTRWTHRELTGMPAVRNLTPELGTRGLNSEEFGNASVRTQWRTVEPDGTETVLFGRTLIADRDRSLEVPSIYRGGIGRALVEGSGAPPYSEQTIWLRGTINEETGEERNNGYGIPPPSVGRPGMNQNVVYPSGRMVTSIGSPLVTSNVLEMRRGIAQYAYGRPFVQLQNRFVLDAGDIRAPALGEPLVTPFWIKGVSVDSGAWGRRGTQYGRPRVSMYRGFITRAGVGNVSRYAQPRLALHRRYIDVRGIQAYRFGWHSAGDGTVFVTPFGRASSAVVGRPVVEREPYLGPQTLSLRGIAPPTITNSHFVSLLHREMRLNGFHSLRMGASRGGDTPYLPQSLRVHRPMPTMPEGTDMMTSGTPWVSYRVRELQVEGNDYFEMGYDHTNFAARMRVYNTYTPVAPEQSASPVGIGDTAIGVPNVLRGTHYILPDGNADQYRKGAF